MMTEQSSKEPLIKEEVCKEHYQKNLEEEEEGIGQLTLSQDFMNRANPSASPSMGTPLISGATATTRKRSRLTIKSAAYSSPVMEKAKALKASLDPRHPSFIKFLSRSHVTQGFWMVSAVIFLFVRIQPQVPLLQGLPAGFCRIYLPNHDDTIQLEGDNGLQYETKFLADRQGLSGGWRGFSLGHNLQEGDAVVFHLVKQYKFKVYAVRTNNLDHRVHERQLETAAKDVNVCQNMENLVEQTPCIEKNCQNDGQPETDYELGGEIMKDDSSSESFVDLKNFSIVVNGCPMDSQFSCSARVKYYELCCARKSYLHDGFLKNINYTLAVGIILGTVSIADDIKACTLLTSLTDFEDWDKTLAGFQHLGMDVGFLQERLRELSMLAIEFQECNEANRHSKVINEENDLNKEIESVEKRLMELKEAMMNLQVERDALDAHFQICNLTFQEMAKRPW